MESIIAIDAGTTSSRTIAFNKKIQQLAISQFEFTQIFPKKSWVEHDPNEIWKTQLNAVKEVLKDEKSETSVLKEKTEALMQDSMKLGEIIYKEAQEKAEKEKAKNEKPGAKGKSDKKTSKSSKQKDEKVVDADFEDVTEKKDSDKDNEKSA